VHAGRCLCDSNSCRLDLMISRGDRKLYLAQGILRDSGGRLFRGNKMNDQGRKDAEEEEEEEEEEEREEVFNGGSKSKAR